MRSEKNITNITKKTFFSLYFFNLLHNYQNRPQFYFFLNKMRYYSKEPTFRPVVRIQTSPLLTFAEKADVPKHNYETLLHFFDLQLCGMENLP